jgi:leucyl/phenylalanyl-tRNA---protein transferase
VPIEPQPTPWNLPVVAPTDQDLVAVGADLAPGTLLAAYRTGLFPMPIERLPGRTEVAWWSPDPRGVLPLDGLIVTRSLRRSRERFEVRVNSAFEQIVDACADPSRPGAWITPDVRKAYLRLHELGWAHSVESWAPDGQLAGGLYGVAIGGLFAGESMFHEAQPWGRDASKVALAALVDLLSDEHAADRVLDVQWETTHLRTLGVVEIPRAEYLSRLRAALPLPLPPVFDPKH